MTPLNRCSLQRFGACWIKPQIRIKGQLGAQWGAWFDGMTITQTANGETLIAGLVADQAALFGLLRKGRDLGLPLRSVSCSEPGSVDRPVIAPSDPGGQ